MSKKKHKKGILPTSVIRSAPNKTETHGPSESKQSGKVQATKAPPVSSAGKGNAKAKSSTSVTPAITKKKGPVKPSIIDPVTGKKKGTLFSAAPSAQPKLSRGQKNQRQHKGQQAAKHKYNAQKLAGDSLGTSDVLPGGPGGPTQSNPGTPAAAGTPAKKKHQQKRTSSDGQVCSRPSSVSQIYFRSARCLSSDQF